MSLIRQIGWLLAGVLLTALGGALVVNLMITRDTLQTELRLKNSDNAQTLALALSQQAGDAARMELLVSAQFDTGFYSSIRLRRADGTTLVQRVDEARPESAPAWFATLLPIGSTPGVAQVSDGWRALGQVEVVSHVAYAHDLLWRSAGLVALWMLLLTGIAAALAIAVVGRIRRPLDATVEQAKALVEGRYLLVDAPDVVELRPMTDAMNGMVQRVRQLFEAQAAHIETLQRQTLYDALTGLPHRAAFVGQFNALLHREDGAQGGSLVLVRLADLAELNRTHGHETTDRVLRVVAELLQAYPARVRDCLVGRLNGSDFALCVPASGMAAETASSISAALSSSLSAMAVGAQVHVGAVEFHRDLGAGDVLARADLALARAENRGPFAVEVLQGDFDVGLGERAWRAQLIAALDEGRLQLGEFALLDARGHLVHLEAPLRVQLDLGGPHDVAARWLPLAVRHRLTARADAKALALALDSIARDGRPRGVNIAAASLAEGGFATHLQQQLHDRPQVARMLWLEVPERAALDQFSTLQEMARLLRPLGVRIGLEHAGAQLHRIDRLYELGLDYVKLDASLCAGVAASEAAREFVRSTVALLHALSVQALAEGVVDEVDATVLFECGIDGITGPWAQRRVPAG